MKIGPPWRRIECSYPTTRWRSRSSRRHYLFNDTLEANVRLAQPDASRAAIERALSQAALSEFVASLPEGLQTRVGERGVQLSGGQRQRIAIARAFLKDAPILILDEATSHLDTLSEMHVAALQALMANRPLLSCAPPVDGRTANLILVLDSGVSARATPRPTARSARL